MTGPFIVQTSPPGGFVLDASVPARWCYTSQGTVYTSGVLWRVMPVKVCVPTCWPLHLVETLRSSQFQGLKSIAEVDHFLWSIEALPIFLEDDTPARAWPDILHLARTHSLTVYNAAYLELSLRLKLPLATIDASLTHAAATAGVSIFTP